VPAGDYHNANGVRTGLCAIGSTLGSHDSFSGDEAELAALVQFLLHAYDEAARSANDAGFEQWPVRIAHGDWHPGNLVFRNHRVAGVVDFDSVRMATRMIDVANGALQFSIVAGGDPANWPDHLDAARYSAFLRGYARTNPLTSSEQASLPPLMIEALIAECVPPIAETGSVGPWSGFRVLQMVRRKVDWINAKAGLLTADISASSQL